jgi:hypothetical protein
METKIKIEGMDFSENDYYTIQNVIKELLEFKIRNNAENTQSNNFYKPMCPYGYDDCIYDCNYIKALYPDWYKELECPTECEDCIDGSMYDDEDK